MGRETKKKKKKKKRKPDVLRSYTYLPHRPTTYRLLTYLSASVCSQHRCGLTRGHECWKKPANGSYSTASLYHLMSSLSALWPLHQSHRRASTDLVSVGRYPQSTYARYGPGPAPRPGVERGGLHVVSCIDVPGGQVSPVRLHPSLSTCGQGLVSGGPRERKNETERCGRYGMRCA